MADNPRESEALRPFMGIQMRFLHGKRILADGGGLIPAGGLHSFGVALRAICAAAQRSNFVLIPQVFLKIRKRMLADGGGFEPPMPFGIHAFQACALDHSATHPELAEEV